MQDQDLIDKLKKALKETIDELDNIARNESDLWDSSAVDSLKAQIEEWKKLL